MSAGQESPPAQINMDVSLVRRLLESQFPRWANLPIKPVEFSGSDNRTFHLGEDMLVRMPSAARYAMQVEKEQYWLPKLGPLLPLSIPMPLAIGESADDYPWSWSIYRWIKGKPAIAAHLPDPCGFAISLAEFLIALQRIDASDGPPPGPHNFYRGGSLATYEAETYQAIAALHGKIDTNTAEKVWKAAVATKWNDVPVWVHGDVSASNLLVNQERLSAVIDFGCLGVGDPACDLSIAWTFFEGKSRDTFRAALPFDDATWARGRGWTLWKALISFADLGNTSPLKAKKWRRIIDEVLADR